MRKSIIPDYLTNIGHWPFCGRSNLEKFELPNSITSIGYGAFAVCSSLINITLNGSVTKWNDITKGFGWNNCVCVKDVHCTDGDVAIK